MAGSTKYRHSEPVQNCVTVWVSFISCFILKFCPDVSCFAFHFLPSSVFPSFSRLTWVQLVHRHLCLSFFCSSLVSRCSFSRSCSVSPLCSCVSLSHLPVLYFQLLDPDSLCYFWLIFILLVCTSVLQFVACLLLFLSFPQFCFLPFVDTFLGFIVAVLPFFVNKAVCLCVLMNSCPFFMPNQTNYLFSRVNNLNKQTDLKGKHNFTLFYFVYMQRTPPPF